MNLQDILTAKGTTVYTTPPEATLAEAVRQMFGEGGGRQVANPNNALVTGIGVIPYARNWGISAAMILEA